MFHRGLSKKQFLTLGYTYLISKRGMNPTCRNVLEAMLDYGAFEKNSSGTYPSVRSTFQQLEVVHRLLKSERLGLNFAPSIGPIPKVFYLNERGIEIVKSYVKGDFPLASTITKLETTVL